MSCGACVFIIGDKTLEGHFHKDNNGDIEVGLAEEDIEDMDRIKSGKLVLQDGHDSYYYGNFNVASGQFDTFRD